MIKNKILKLLPFWLVGLIFTVALQNGIFLVSQPQNLAINKPQAPEPSLPIQPRVLGADTSIRGQPPKAETFIKQIKAPTLESIEAKSFLAFDLSTGQTLLEKNPDEKLWIASLTKLMTALVVYKNANLNTSLTVEPKDTLAVNPALGLIPGDELKVLDVFNAMLIGSCNDAALALSNYTASTTGQSFIKLMNQQAKALGMANSNFSNALGFDSNYNYSTARDLKILISVTEKLSAFTDLGRRASYKFTASSGNTYATSATNKLIKNHPDISAIKTGYTDGAGGAMASKISMGNHKIVILVLDSPDREADTLKLKDEVTSSFKWE